MHAILPQIMAALDSEVAETIIVDISPDLNSKWARRSPAVSSPDGIIVFDPDPDLMAGYLGHEVVHMLVHHQESFWTATPVILEEGIANLVGRGLDGIGEVIITGHLPEVVVESLLKTRLEDMHEQEGDEREGTYRMATYLAAILGLERIKDLSRQAHEAGHATIQTEVLLRAIEEAEGLRELDSGELSPVVLDPLFGRIATGVPRELKMRMSFDFPED